MIFDDLNDDNFSMFAMKEYNDIQCTDIEEFYDDLKNIIKWKIELKNKIILT